MAWERRDATTPKELRQGKVSECDWRSINWGLKLAALCRYLRFGKRACEEEILKILGKSWFLWGYSKILRVRDQTGGQHLHKRCKILGSTQPRLTLTYVQEEGVCDDGFDYYEITEGTGSDWLDRQLQARAQRHRWFGTGAFIQVTTIYRYLQMGYQARADLYFHKVSVLSQYQANPRVGPLETLYHVFAYHKCHLDMGHGRWSAPWGNKVNYCVCWYQPCGKCYNPDGPIRGSWSMCSIHLRFGSIKGQSTVEAATFGSEFVALCICNEFIVALRYKLRVKNVSRPDWWTGECVFVSCFECEYS